VFPLDRQTNIELTRILARFLLFQANAMIGRAQISGALSSTIPHENKGFT
jgi:hypothetical protein